MPDDVLCLSHLRWGFVFQRPNHLMLRCARERRVFFVEEPIHDGGQPRLEVRTVARGLNVVVPRIPRLRTKEATERAQRELLDGLVCHAAIHDPVLWLYTPMALGFAGHLRPAATVYDCMDELSLFHGAPPELRAREEEVFARADLVFTGGQSLWEAKRHRHRSVHAFPSSVEAEHFAKARQPLEDPADQRAIPHPRLGFFGVLDERLDRDLLRNVAEMRPELHVVLVGPVAKIDPASLPRLPNIHWLGPKTYDELPSYLAGWDVAIMPFARNDATRFISPTKTLEYLAAGKPVVSTSIRDVVRPYGERGLVRIADDPRQFVSAVEDALGERGTRAEAVRQKASDAFVAGTSWDRTWDAMHALLRGVLSRGRRGGALGEEAPCSIT